MQFQEKRLFISDFPESFDKQNVETKFSKYGKVLKIDIKERTITINKSKYFAYINMEVSDTNLKKCLDDFSKQHWNGKFVKVELAKESFLEKMKKERERSIKDTSIATNSENKIYSHALFNESTVNSGNKRIIFDEDDTAENGNMVNDSLLHAKDSLIHQNAESESSEVINHRRLFISELYEDITDEDLRKFFCKYSYNVNSIRIMERMSQTENHTRYFALINVEITDINLEKCLKYFSRKQCKSHILNVEVVKKSFFERMEREQKFQLRDSIADNGVKRKFCDDSKQIDVMEKVLKAIDRDDKPIEEARKQQSNERRLTSLNKMKTEHESQQTAIKSALHNLNEPKKNKIIFEDTSDNENNWLEDTFLDDSDSEKYPDDNFLDSSKIDSAVKSNRFQLDSRFLQDKDNTNAEFINTNIVIPRYNPQNDKSSMSLEKKSQIIDEFGMPIPTENATYKVTGDLNEAFKKSNEKETSFSLLSLFNRQYDDDGDDGNENIMITVNNRITDAINDNYEANGPIIKPNEKLFFTENDPRFKVADQTVETFRRRDLRPSDALKTEINSIKNNIMRVLQKRNNLVVSDLKNRGIGQFLHNTREKWKKTENK